jgi:hypothetical protein
MDDQEVLLAPLPWELPMWVAVSVLRVLMWFEAKWRLMVRRTSDKSGQRLGSDALESRR